MPKCEICLENEAEMDFNAPAKAGMFKAKLCLKCWSSAPNDLAIVEALVLIRCHNKGLSVSELTEEQFSTILE